MNGLIAHFVCCNGSKFRNYLQFILNTDKRIIFFFMSSTLVC